MRPWLGYHRISRVGDRPDTPISEGEAEREIRGLATRLGVEVELLAVEKDVSGGRMRRPILDRAVTAIETGQYGGLLVAHYDRLSRAHLADAYVVIQRIENAGGQVLSARENFDVSTPEGQMGRDVFLSMSRMQRERNALYLRASKKRAVELGVWPFTAPPPGYIRTRRKEGGDGKLYPAEATAVARVRDIFRSKLLGESKVSIATRHQIGVSHVDKILRNRAYLGEIRIRFRNGEEFVNPNAHEPLVDRATFEAVQIAGPRPARNGNPPALLTGLVRCANCGMTMSPGGDRYGANYRCPARPRAGKPRCGRRSLIRQSALEQHVEALVLPHLEGIRFAAHARVGEVGELERQLAETEAERDLYQQITRATDDPHAFLAGARTRQAEVDRVTAELARARASLPELPNVPDLAAHYRAWPVEKRRHLLRGTLAAIVVEKGHRAVQERVWVIAHDGALLDHAPDHVRVLGTE